MSDAVNIESLSIEVSSNAQKAQSGIEALASSLEKLKGTAKGGAGLPSFSDKLEKLNEALNRLNGRNAAKLEKLSNALNGMKGLSRIRLPETLGEQIEALGCRVQRLDLAKLERVARALSALKGVGSIKIPVEKPVTPQDVPGGSSDSATTDHSAVQEVNAELERCSSLWTDIGEKGRAAFEKIRKVASSASQKASEAFEPVKEKLSSMRARGVVEFTLLKMKAQDFFSEFSYLGNTIKQPFEALGSVISRVHQKLKGIRSAMDKASKSVRKTGEAARETEGRFRRLLSSFKRIALYRAIRYVLSAITRSLKEGIGNVYQYSKAVGGTFSTSMDKLSSSMQYLKNSLGAMLSPLINAITPWVERMVDGFVDLLNLINQVIAKVSGAKTWTKALKYQKEYAEATDAAAEANQKLADSVLGIDELNILSDKSKSGSAGDAVDYSAMFTEAAFDDALDSPMGKFLTGIAEAVSAIWRNGKEVLIVFSSIFVAKTILNGVKKLSAAFPGLNLNLTNLFGGLKLSQGWVTTLTKSIMGAAGLVAGFTLAKTGAYELTNALNGRSGSLGAGIASLVGGVGLAVAGGAIIGGPIGALIGGLVGLAGALSGVVKAWKEEGASSVYDEMGLSTAQLTALTEGLGQEIKEQAKVWEEHEEKTKDLREEYKKLAETFEENLRTINTATGSTEEDVGKVFESLQGLVEKADEGLTHTTETALESYRQLFMSNDDMITEEEQAVLDAMKQKYKDQKGELGKIQDNITEIFSKAMTERGYLLDGEIQQINKLVQKMAEIGTFELNLGKIEMETVLEDLTSGKIRLSKDQFETFIAEQSEKANALIEQARSTYAKQLAYAQYAFAPDSAEYKTATEAARENYDRVLSDASSYMQNVVTALMEPFRADASMYDKYHYDNAVLDWLDSTGAVIEGFLVDHNLLDADMVGETGSEYLEKKGASEEAKASMEALAELLKKYNTYNTEMAAAIEYMKDKRKSLSAYAEGGFPETGEMFLARENGIPEFVGSIGRRTAVANNEQIVESVAQGVADANAEQNALLREQNELLRALLAKKTEVRIGGRTVTEAVETQTKANGYQFVPV